MKPNWKNRTLFIGDNLDIMRAMNNESVDLIVIDPPSNAGRGFDAATGSPSKGVGFRDCWRWEEGVQQEWLDHIKDKSPRTMDAIECARRVHGDAMGACACFISVRLLEMRRLLKPSGSLILHCDPTASHFLKVCLDSIFGPKNFINEIVWCLNGLAFRKTKSFNRNHDILFWYAKGSKHTFNGPRANDWWTDIKPLSSRSKEWTGYPAQKPVELYERIIKAASNEDDVVLDSFCGCGTTCVAAERLGRQWVGIDTWENTCEIIKECMIREFGASVAKDIHYSKTAPKRTDGGG